MASGIFIFQLLYKILETFSDTLNNYFWYTQLSFAFLLKKDFYFDLNDIDALYLFLLHKVFFLFRAFFFTFLLLLLQKDFGTLPLLCFEAFFMFWYLLTIFIYVYKNNYKKFLIVINHFYIYTKNYKKYFFKIPLKLI